MTAHDDRPPTDDHDKGRDGRLLMLAGVTVGLLVVLGLMYLIGDWQL